MNNIDECPERARTMAAAGVVAVVCIGVALVAGAGWVLGKRAGQGWDRQKWQRERALCVVGADEGPAGTVWRLGFAGPEGPRELFRVFAASPATQRQAATLAPAAAAVTTNNAAMGKEAK